MSTHSVWKFPIQPTVDRDEYGNMVVDIEMPGVPDILRADRQGDTIYVWAGVQPESEPTTQRFIIVPTGSEYDRSFSTYVGTAFMGSLVFHIFHIR